MFSYRKIWIVISFAFILVVGFWGLKHAYWGDESHFVDTVRLFLSSSWFVLLKDYPEVTTPLVYMIYATWGKLFGDGLITLRILSLIISFSFLMILFQYVAAYLKNEKLTLVICCVVLMNPYVWGLSVFVFTDMLTIFFIFIALYLFKQDKFILASVFLGLSVLCRQYAIIFIVAAWLFAFIKFLNKKDREAFQKFTLYLFISILPFIYLVIIWNGLSPPSAVKKYIPDSAISWNPHAIVAYITFSAAYVLPLLILFGQGILRYKNLLIPALIIGSVYFIFPVEVSDVTRIQTSLDTVGLAHKFLLVLAGRGILSEIILFLLFSTGVWILMIFLNNDLKAVLSGEIHGFLFLSIVFYVYLLIMPLSYQIWEKYLIMILPVVCLRLGFLAPDYLK